MCRQRGAPLKMKLTARERSSLAMTRATMSVAPDGATPSPSPTAALDAYSAACAPQLVIARADELSDVDDDADDRTAEFARHSHNTPAAQHRPAGLLMPGPSSGVLAWNYATDEWHSSCG